jgi:hypothetical protein
MFIGNRCGITRRRSISIACSPAVCSDWVSTTHTPPNVQRISPSFISRRGGIAKRMHCWVQFGETRTNGGPMVNVSLSSYLVNLSPAQHPDKHARVFHYSRKSLRSRQRRSFLHHCPLDLTSVSCTFGSSWTNNDPSNRRRSGKCER